MRDQPGFPRSLATEDAQSCTGCVAGQKRPNLGDQIRSRACGAMGLVERRQWFAKSQCRRFPTGEGRRKPSSVLSPRDLCSNQRFTEVTTKLFGAGVEVTGRPDRLDGSGDCSVGTERVSRGVRRHGDCDSQPRKNACPIQDKSTDPGLPTISAYVAGYLSRHFRGRAEELGIGTC